MLRRFTEHLKTQNWVAIWLDLTVVVVGIFLAFQVERWYALQSEASNAYERLSSLSEDVARNLQVLDRQIQRRDEQIEAAEKLLELDNGNAAEIGPDEFYGLLANVSNSITPRFQRGAYDLLISTGQLDLVQLPALKSALAEFYAAVDEFVVYNQGSWSSHRNTFEPYIINNLDHAALLRRIHPEEFDSITPSYEPKQFADVIGNGIFEGIIVQRRHAMVDERSRLLRLFDGAKEIDRLLSESSR